MVSTTAVQVCSLTFDIVGGVSVLVLIGTFLRAKSLPQRTNPFLLNFLIVTFFTQIPPTLLFFSGHLGREPPEWLCSTQSVLMDGVSPMCGLAWVIVVFHTWRDIKTTLSGGTPLGKRSPFVKVLLLAAPYIAFLSWSLASLAAALVVPPQWELAHLVFCANESDPGIEVRRSIGFALITNGFLQFFLEILIGCLIYRAWGCTQFSQTLFSFGLRVCVFCLAQLLVLLLAIINSAVFPNYIPLKQITQLLVSTNALCTFLIFGTQKHVLNAWKFWERRKPTSDEPFAVSQLEGDNVV